MNNQIAQENFSNKITEMVTEAIMVHKAMESMKADWQKAPWPATSSQLDEYRYSSS